MTGREVERAAVLANQRPIVLTLRCQGGSRSRDGCGKKVGFVYRTPVGLLLQIQRHLEGVEYEGDDEGNPLDEDAYLDAPVIHQMDWRETGFLDDREELARLRWWPSAIASCRRHGALEVDLSAVRAAVDAGATKLSVPQWRWG